MCTDLSDTTATDAADTHHLPRHDLVDQVVHAKSRHAVIMVKAPPMLTVPRSRSHLDLNACGNWASTRFNRGLDPTKWQSHSLGTCVVRGA